MEIKKIFNPKSLLVSIGFYAGGDTLGAILIGEFSLTRFLAMALFCSVFYTLEIPNLFRWIQKFSDRFSNKVTVVTIRTLFAVAYFNPLWIARQYLVIDLAMGNPISWSILSVSASSFVVNLLPAVAGNVIIQGLLPLKYRFFASGIFSLIMCMLYAFAK